MLLRWRNCGVRPPSGGSPGPASGEPIIDRDHERVVALLTDPARRSNNRGTEAKYLLTSVAYCGECGGHVVGTNEFTYKLKNGTHPHYPHCYKCPRAGCMKVQRRMADVDEHVTRVVLGVLEREGVRLLGGDPVAADGPERIAALEAKLALAATSSPTTYHRRAIEADQRPAAATRRRAVATGRRSPHRRWPIRRAGRPRGLGAGRRRDQEAHDPPAGHANHDPPGRAGQRSRYNPDLVTIEWEKDTRSSA